MSVVMRKLARKQMRANVGLTKKVAREHLAALQGIESALARAYRTTETVDDAVCLEAVSSVLATRAAVDPIAAMLAAKLLQVRLRLGAVADKDWFGALRVVEESILTHSARGPGEAEYLGFIDHSLA